MEQQFEHLNLSAQRIKAVTPADLSVKDLDIYANPSRFHWLTGPELSCSFSHISALKQFVKSGAPFCLIFEDDVIISHGLNLFIQAFENNPPNLDILRLEDSEYPLRLAPEPQTILGKIGIFQFYSWCAGSAGYIVSRRGAQRIIVGQELRKTQADRALFNPYEPLARDLIIKHTLPALCKQDNVPGGPTANGGSDLEHARQDRSTMEKTHILRRFLYKFMEFMDRDLRIGTLKLWNRTIRGANKRPVRFKAD